MNLSAAFSKRHLILAALVIVVFGTVNAIATESWSGFYYALIGPFAGGAYRDWQSCCADFSLSVFLISGPVLVLGFVTQLIPHLQGGRGFFRITVWGASWVIWCCSSWYSFGHAAS